MIRSAQRTASAMASTRAEWESGKELPTLRGHAEALATRFSAGKQWCR